MKIKCLVDDEGHGLVSGKIYEAFYTDLDEDEVIVSTETHGECFMYRGEYEEA